MSSDSSPPLTYSITLSCQPVQIVAAPHISDSDFRSAIDSSLFKQWLKNTQSENGILHGGSMSLTRVLIQFHLSSMTWKTRALLSTKSLLRSLCFGEMEDTMPICKTDTLTPGLTVKEMEELRDDIKMHLGLDRATPTHIGYWEGETSSLGENISLYASGKTGEYSML